MEFDELLNKHIGPFGLFQAICFGAMVFQGVPSFLATQELILQVSPPHSKLHVNKICFLP